MRREKKKKRNREDRTRNMFTNDKSREFHVLTEAWVIQTVTKKWHLFK